MTSKQNFSANHRLVNYTFFYKQSICETRPENCLSFSKKPPQKLVEQLFSRSINFYCLNIQTFKILQGHLDYVMHTFELASPKVCISVKFPMQKKGFSLFL